jgi:23S rRNA (pseudouridine1915-N3)-methyltransferase
MKITILAVGQRQPAWVDAAVSDFLGRLPADFKVELKEIKAESRSGGTDEASRAMTAEALRLRAALPAGATVVALDESGQDWPTARFAQAMQRWRDEAIPVAFVIGGADGLEPSLKRSASLLLRLSSMTLPHALARVVLAEQIYRAWSILARHPYHRA